MCTATQEVSFLLVRLFRNCANIVFSSFLSFRAQREILDPSRALGMTNPCLGDYDAAFDGRRSSPPPFSSSVEQKKTSGPRKNRLVPRLVKVLALIVLACLLPFELVHAQPLTKIRVANIGGTSDHLQVAINGGIYRKHGFDVENIQVGSSATVVQSLIAGEVSFAHVGAVPVVAAVASGIDLKIVAVFINRFNYVMVTLPDLQKPQDLKGKTLAISRLGSGDEFATREALRRWGLDPDKDVRLLQVGLTMARLAALQGRHVQASLLSPPQIVEVQRMGLNVMADLTDLDVEYAHYTLVTKGSLIAENRPFVDRFMRAYVDGIKFYRSHPEAAIPYLRKFSKQSDAELRIVYENLRKWIREEPVPTTGGVQTIIGSLRTDKEKELDPRRVIDTSFLTGAVAK
jgi:ABC-type nitrate/sulfonate/bicarbonate transport system substrate-binding protein